MLYGCFVLNSKRFKKMVLDFLVPYCTMQRKSHKKITVFKKFGADKRSCMNLHVLWAQIRETDKRELQDEQDTKSKVTSVRQ